MNKVRLIRIYELRGKIHPIEQIVIDLLDGIEEVPKSNGSIRYWKDGRIYFTYYLYTKNIYLSSYLENVFNDKFGYSKEETRVIMKYLLEKHLNLKINEVR